MGLNISLWCYMSAITRVNYHAQRHQMTAVGNVKGECVMLSDIAAKEPNGGVDWAGGCAGMVLGLSQARAGVATGHITMLHPPGPRMVITRLGNNPLLS